MRSTIRNTDDLGGGIVSSLLNMLLTGGSLSGGQRQVPIVIPFFNAKVDVYLKNASRWGTLRLPNRRLLVNGTTLIRVMWDKDYK